MNTKIQTLSVHGLVTTQFHLNKYCQQLCDKYYILYWQSKYLSDQLLEHPQIIREGIEYIPVFQASLSLKHIVYMPNQEIRLSFRKLMSSKIGYALIQPVCSIIS